MAEQDRFYGWGLLVALWIVLLINMGFTVYGSSVINAAMAAQLGFDRSALGGAFAIFQWMSGLPGPLVAICVTRLGARSTLLLGSGLLVLGAACMALITETVLQFTLIFGVLMGLAAVVGGPLAAQATIARWFVRRRALAMSLTLTGPAIGGFVAPLLFDRVIANSGGDWRAGWWLVALGGAITALVTLFFVREAPAQDQGEASPVAASAGSVAREPAPSLEFGQVLRTPAFWLMIASLVGLFAGFMMFAAHGVIHLQDIGYTSAQAASSFSTMFLALLGGNLLFAILGDRIESRVLLSAALLVFAAGLLLAFGPSGVAGLYIYPVLLGGGFGFGFSTMMILPGQYFGDRAYVAIMGVILALSTTYGAIGAFGAGFSFDHFGSYAPAFYCVVVLSLVGAILALFLRAPSEGRKTALRSVA